MSGGVSINSRNGLSHEISCDAFFVFRFRDAAGFSRFSAFQKIGEIFTQSPHRLQAFKILQNFLGRVSVYLIPVL